MPAGFYDAVVAAPSQAAALKAWGMTTDLFAAGRASVVTDEAIRSEALGRPGEVIRRARGDEAAMLGPEPADDLKVRGKPALKAARPKPPPPDRSDLDAAERRVSEAERELAAELEQLAAKLGRFAARGDPRGLTATLHRSPASGLMRRIGT